MTELLDDDGENRAVRMFLSLYGGANGVAVGAMRKHLTFAGYPYWPEWVAQEVDQAHLTKAGAQLWIRHLFSLEASNAG